MVELPLEPEEQGVLADVLESYLKRLRFEISNTESIDFRKHLDHREQVVMKTLRGLGRETPGYPERTT